MGHLKPRATVLREALEKKRQAEVPIAKALLTVDEAVAMLRISKWTLYKYIQRNELPSIKFGKRRFFREPDLLAFIERHQAEAFS
jgi:excisionase family DNA binding protein